MRLHSRKERLIQIGPKQKKRKRLRFGTKTEHNIDRPLGTAPQVHNPSQDLVQCLKEQADFVRDRRHWEEMSAKLENLEESHREIDLNNRLREMLLKLRHEFESEKLHHAVPTSYERILADHLGLEWDENNSFRKKKLPKGERRLLKSKPHEIFVHGHYQCTRCGQVTEPCCHGEGASFQLPYLFCQPVLHELQRGRKFLSKRGREFQKAVRATLNRTEPFFPEEGWE